MESLHANERELVTMSLLPDNSLLVLFEASMATLSMERMTF